MRATHVLRLCSGPWFESQPRSLCCVSLPLSYPVSCHTLPLSCLSIKPEKAKKKKLVQPSNGHNIYLDAVSCCESILSVHLGAFMRPGGLLSVNPIKSYFVETEYQCPLARAEQKTNSQSTWGGTVIKTSNLCKQSGDRCWFWQTGCGSKCLDLSWRNYIILLIHNSKYALREMSCWFSNVFWKQNEEMLINTTWIGNLAIHYWLAVSSPHLYSTF